MSPGPFRGVQISNPTIRQFPYHFEGIEPSLQTLAAFFTHTDYYANDIISGIRWYPS